MLSTIYTLKNLRHIYHHLADALPFTKNEAIVVTLISRDTILDYMRKNYMLKRKLNERRKCLFLFACARKENTESIR